MVKKKDKRRDFKPRIVDGHAVIFLADNKRAYKVDLSMMLQTQFQAEKLSDRRVIRRDVTPPVFTWEVTKNKHQAYPSHISKLCEEVWQTLRLEKKKRETFQEPHFLLTEENLEEVEAAIKSSRMLDHISFQILQFSFPENTLKMLSLMKEYKFGVDHIRMCLIEGLDIEVVKALVIEHNVELCGKILFPDHSRHKLSHSAIKQNLPSLKFLLSYGCNFSENCWKTGSKFIKKLSRECFHNFLIRCCRKLKFGDDINNLIMLYYLSVHTKDDSHNLYKTNKRKSRTTPPTIPRRSGKMNSPLILASRKDSIKSSPKSFSLNTPPTCTNLLLDSLKSQLSEFEQSMSGSSGDSSDVNNGRGKKKKNKHKEKQRKKRERVAAEKAEKALAKKQRQVEGLKRREAKSLQRQSLKQKKFRKQTQTSIQKRTPSEKKKRKDVHIANIATPF